MCYFRASLCNPGYFKKMKNPENLDIGKDCNKCLNFKPPRAYHCR